MGIFREFEVWPKFYLRSCCAVCDNAFNCIAIYREFIVEKTSPHSRFSNNIRIHIHVIFIFDILIHRIQVTQICVGKSSLVAYSVPSHYQNQCSLVENWTLGNRIQSNSNKYTTVSIQENKFGNVVCQITNIFVGHNVLNTDDFYCAFTVSPG